MIGHLKFIFVWIFLIPQRTGNVFIWNFVLQFLVFIFFRIRTRQFQLMMNFIQMIFFILTAADCGSFYINSFRFPRSWANIQYTAVQTEQRTYYTTERFNRYMASYTGQQRQRTSLLCSNKWSSFGAQLFVLSVQKFLCCCRQLVIQAKPGGKVQG